MKTNNNCLFYVNYAGLECAIIAPEQWRKYFKKLYEASDTLSYSEQSIHSKFKGTLTIQETKSSNIYLNFRNTCLLRTMFTVKVSNAPIFLFPSVHQCVARIFNILFHVSGGFVLHSSSLLIGDKASLFVGESGRGKSTIVDRLHIHNPSSFILSDNSAFIKRESSKFVVYPSPYLETNRLASLQRSLPEHPPYEIDLMFFPYHANTNCVLPLLFEEKIKLLQLNSHVPFQTKKLLSVQEIRNLGNLVFNLARSVKMYNLGLVKDTSFLYDVHNYVHKNRFKI
jgi:hypothetical protein